MYGTDTTGTAFEADKALQQAAKDAMKEAVKQGQAGPPAAPTAVAYPTATTQSQQAANMVSVLQADPEYAKILDLQDELYKTIQDIKTDNSELSFFDVLLGALTGGASLLLQPKKLSAIRRRKMLPTYYSMYERALQLGLSYRSLAAQTVAAINKAEQAQLKEIEEQKKMAPGIFQASMEISQSLGLYFKKLRAELLKTLNPNDSQAVDNFYGRTLEDILLHPLFSYDLSSKWPGREYFNEKGELDVRRVLKDVQLGKLDPAVQVYLLGRNAILKRLSGLPLDSAEEEVDSLTGPNGRLTLLLKELETKQRDATALVGNQDTKQGFFNTMVAAQETLRKLINDLDEYIARRRAKEEQ
ncbi:MAG: hypothetical protein D6746_05025 [Bacteroidetes bacterium]|nr:MAG: hypothetical protein D6746_05025 [Bacteroidota bacterium]